MAPPINDESKFYPEFLQMIDPIIIGLNLLALNDEGANLRTVQEQTKKVVTFAANHFPSVTSWSLVKTLETIRGWKYETGPFANPSARGQTITPVIGNLIEIQRTLQNPPLIAEEHSELLRLSQKVSDLTAEINKLKERIQDLEEKRVDQRTVKKGWF